MLSRRSLEFFVYSNLFIAGCAVVMTNQTYRWVIGDEPNENFLFFVFFSTICSYSFHWYLTSASVLPSSRIEWIRRYKLVHLLLFIVGGIGAGIFFFFLLPYWHWLLISVVMTFLYTAPKIPHPVFRSLRKVALGKTIFLAGVWMSVTTLLPMLISGKEWKMDFTLFVLSRFFLVYAICILFDYRDREDDREAGIRSLITLLNEKGILRIFIFSLLVFGVSTGLLIKYDYSLLHVIILLVPGIIVASLYRYATTHFDDIFYYFILDGLMALSGFFVWI